MPKKKQPTSLFQHMGHRIKLMRARKGWSLAEFGIMIGSSQSAACRIENDQRSITVRELEDICEALGVTVLAFVEELERSRVINLAAR